VENKGNDSFETIRRKLDELFPDDENETFPLPAKPQPKLESLIKTLKPEKVIFILEKTKREPKPVIDPEVATIVEEKKEVEEIKPDLLE